MRELKFRAWDKQMKNMFVPAYIVDGHVADFLDKDEQDRAVGLWSATRPTRIGDCILMQYTGLKDKNGVEIYEGDIVKDESGEFWIIEFGKLPLNKAGDCVCTYQAFYAKALHQGHQMYDCTEPAAWQEVIGNIYENPELLTPSNQQVGKQEETA